MKFGENTDVSRAVAEAPARSLVSIDDVGVAVAFQATDAAKLITGATLCIDGGYTSSTEDARLTSNGN